MTVVPARNDLPWILYDRFLDDEEITAEEVVEAWTSAEFPCRIIEQAAWEELFDHVEFVSDDPMVAKPTAAIHLWRGFKPGFENGMSWTDDENRARWFADRLSTVGVGLVVDRWIEPKDILAFVGQRGEREWVIMTPLVEEVDGAKDSPLIRD